MGCDEKIIVHKDPQANKDYGWDWTPRLNTGDTISASTWISTGLTQTFPSFDDTSTTVWLAGGTVGQSYEVTNRITTEQGMIDDLTFYMVIKQQ